MVAQDKLCYYEAHRHGNRIPPEPKPTYKATRGNQPYLFIWTHISSMIKLTTYSLMSTTKLLFLMSWRYSKSPHSFSLPMSHYVYHHESIIRAPIPQQSFSHLLPQIDTKPKPGSHPSKSQNLLYSSWNRTSTSNRRVRQHVPPRRTRSRCPAPQFDILTISNQTKQSVYTNTSAPWIEIETETAQAQHQVQVIHF